MKRARKCAQFVARYAWVAFVVALLYIAAASALRAEESKPEPPKWVPVSELLAVKAENVALKMRIMQDEFAKLQDEDKALRVEACKQAKLTEYCIVNWSTKAATERSAPKPTTPKTEKK